MPLPRSIPLLAFAAMTACGQAPSEPAGGDVRKDDVSRPFARNHAAIDEVVSLDGDWRVAVIDGRSLDEPVGLTLNADDTTLWLEPRCAGVARRYTIRSRAISFSPLDPPTPEDTPAAVCAIGLPPQFSETMRALDAATSITRTPSNGVLISGPKHSVTLFAQ